MWFFSGFSSSRPKGPPTLPPGVRLYAIGDIHGRYDLLRELYQLLTEDFYKNPPQTSLEIFLGDYIDRGTSSFEVIEWLSTFPPLTQERICLKGNHEQIFLNGLQQGFPLPLHRKFGLFETLLSYGLDKTFLETCDDPLLLQKALLHAIPPHHRHFLETLLPAFRFEGYFFAHAGIKPKVPLERQEEMDLLWIRSPFHQSQEDHGAFIVHGHTPVLEPDLHLNRLNIDTGAYLTGQLTCAVFENNEIRFLHT